MTTKTYRSEMIITSPYASESQHWYRADGSPAYTMVGANGKERPTTLRDARKHGLLPSVTAIIRGAAAPGLEQWKRRQLGLALLTLPRLPDESEDAFLARAEQDAGEQARKAAERGTELHGAFEQHLQGRYFGDLWLPWLVEMLGELQSKCGHQVWSAEKSFAHPDGYGGKVDLHSPIQPQQWVIDIKTKDGDVSGERKLFDDHLMQGAAYRHGLGMHDARVGILFVSRDKPQASLIEATAEELERGLAMFKALLAFWQAKTGYRP